MQPDQVWQAALGELQLQLTKSTYGTWLRDARLVSHDAEAGLFTIGVEDVYSKDWLENRLRSTIQRTLTGISGSPAEVQFVVVEPGSQLSDAAVSEIGVATGIANDGDYVWTEFGLPPDYSATELADLHPSSEIMRHPHTRQCIVDGLPETNNLIVTGPPGTGKTTLGVCLLKRTARAGRSAVFVDATMFLRAQLDDVRTRGASGQALFNRVVQADLLVFDDWKAERATEWGAGWLNDLVLRRANDRKAGLIITSNDHWDTIRSRNLNGALAPAAVSRLFASSVIANLPPDAPDWRIKQRLRGEGICQKTS